MNSIAIGNGVTSIGSFAFSGCSRLTGVYIADLAKWCAIDFESFANPLEYAHKLYLDGMLVADLVLPDSVTSISDYAFSGCTSLASITIPDSVTNIGENAFTGASIINVILSSNHPNFAYEKGIMYTKDYSKIIYITESAEKVAFPDTMIHIPYSLLHGKKKLKKVEIPNSVMSIDSGAFSSCVELTDITVNDGNTIYHSQGNCLIDTENKVLIAGCKASVIPTDGSVMSIGDSAFSGCAGLSSITVPDSVTSIGEGAFSGCIGLISITIGNSVTCIGSYAFWMCTNLTSITIPDSVMSTGYDVFKDCTGLTSITIGNSVTSTGHSEFSGCTGLAKITIPNNVTSIGGGTFYGCTGLISITIPDSVTNIGRFAFYGCERLKEIWYTSGKERWKTIKKEHKWKGNTGSYTVHCTDGDIPKNES